MKDERDTAPPPSASEKCWMCNGAGIITGSAHAPKCDGDYCADDCPVPVPRPCPQCSPVPSSASEVRVPETAVPGHCVSIDGERWHEPGKCPGAIVNCDGKCCSAPSSASEGEPHPDYGPCDGFLPDGQCSECLRLAGEWLAPAPPSSASEGEGEKCRSCGKARGGACAACHCPEIAALRARIAELEGR